MNQGELPESLINRNIEISAQVFFMEHGYRSPKARIYRNRNCTYGAADTRCAHTHTLRECSVLLLLLLLKYPVRVRDACGKWHCVLGLYTTFARYVVARAEWVVKTMRVAKASVRNYWPQSSCAQSYGFVLILMVGRASQYILQLLYMVYIYISLYIVGRLGTHIHIFLVYGFPINIRI